MSTQGGGNSGGGSTMGGGSAPPGGMNGMQRPTGAMGQGGSGRQGGVGMMRGGRGSRGLVWVKRGDLPYPVRVRTGVTDGSVTEVSGELKEGDEVITALVASDPAKTTTQQQNPFAPQMQRPGGSSSSGRGGR